MPTITVGVRTPDSKGRVVIENYGGGPNTPTPVTPTFTTPVTGIQWAARIMPYADPLEQYNPRLYLLSDAFNPGSPWHTNLAPAGISVTVNSVSPATFHIEHPNATHFTPWNDVPYIIRSLANNVALDNSVDVAYPDTQSGSYPGATRALSPAPVGGYGTDAIAAEFVITPWTYTGAYYNATGIFPNGPGEYGQAYSAVVGQFYWGITSYDISVNQCTVAHVAVVNNFNYAVNPAGGMDFSFTYNPSDPHDSTHSIWLGFVTNGAGYLYQSTNASDVDHFVWDFGDGETETALPNTTTNHIYAVSGDYLVTLTVVDIFGRFSTYWQWVEVTVTGRIGALIHSAQFLYVASQHNATDPITVCVTRYNRDYPYNETRIGQLPVQTFAPTLVQRADGSFLIMACKQADATWSIYESTDTGRTWEEMAAAWDANYTGATFAIGNAGQIVTVAHKNTDSKTYFTVSFDDGATWKPPVDIGASTTPAPTPLAILYRSEGRIDVVSTQGLVRYSGDTGRTWH